MVSALAAGGNGAGKSSSSQPQRSKSRTGGNRITRPTFRDLLERVGLPRPAARVSAIVPATPPHISAHTLHYLYAIKIIGTGCSNAEACQDLDVSLKAAERWRRELREQAEQFFGREVSYEYAARYALDDEWAKLIDSLSATDSHASH